MKVAIFGAGGAIGRAILPELQRRGHAVRLVGRDPAKLAASAGAGVEVVAADLADPAGAAAAASGVDAVLYSVGLPYPRSALYPPLTQTALAAARSAGVDRFLLISTVYPYGRAQTPFVAETHPREPHTMKGQNRKRQADLVLAAHEPGGMRTGVLVLPDFYGPSADLSYAKAIFDAALGGKVATVVGPLDVPHEFVYVPDTAPVIADLLERPELLGRTYHLGGAGTIALRQFCALAERASGTRIIPLAVNQTALRALGSFSPLMKEIVEMYYLFTEPLVLDDAALHAALGNVRKTSYADGIAATLAALAPQRAVHV